jgi:type IV pilus assembly protein PilE
MSASKPKGNRMKRRQRGVSLIELLVVMVVVAILSAIAIPSYRQYVIRSNRTNAKTLLTQTAQALERCYTNSTPYAYNSATCTVGVAAVILPVLSADGTYSVDGVRAPNTYTLTATPQGTQAEDTKCGNFVLTNTGQQTVSGTSTAPECWSK